MADSLINRYIDWAERKAGGELLIAVVLVVWLPIGVMTAIGVGLFALGLAVIQ